MKSRQNAIVLFGFALALGACRDEKATPAPTATPAPVQSPTASVQTSPKPRSTKPATLDTPPDDQASADTWLAIRKDGIELGLLELRSGKRPKLIVENDNASATELRTKLGKIDGPDGIGLDMHLPTGTGRGPYGTRVIKYDDPLYRHALKEELEPEFDVKEVPRLHDGMPPAKFRTLNVARDGREVGSIDFGSTPPKLTVLSDSGDGMGIQRVWDSINEKAELQVRYHFAKDGVETLVDAKAKPGDASYAQTVVLYLIITHEYRKRYAYALDFEN